MTSSPSETGALSAAYDAERAQRPASLPHATEGAPPGSEARGLIATYFGRVREFQRVDWVVYVLWVGLMLGLTS